MFEEAFSFIEEAERQGIALPRNAEGSRYTFYMATGTLSTKRNLDAVWSLVKFARDNYAYCDESGEHRRLLMLVAEESRLEYEVVAWERQTNAEVTKDSKGWKSLQGFLEDNGYDMREVYKEGNVLSPW